MSLRRALACDDHGSNGLVSKTVMVLALFDPPALDVKGTFVHSRWVVALNR